MGNNTSSVEAAAPKRLPHKLSKARSGNGNNGTTGTASTAASAGLSTPSSLPTSVDDQFLNPGYAGPSYLYPFSPATSPTDAATAVPFPRLESESYLSSSVLTTTAAAENEFPPANPSSSSVGVESLFNRRASMISIRQRQERNRRSIFRSKSSSQKQQSPQAAGTRDRPERRNTVIATTSISHPLPLLPPLEGQGQPAPRDSAFPTDAGVEAQQPGRLAVENWQLPAGSRISWNYDLTSYEAKRLLSLVEEPQPLYEEESTRSEKNKGSVVSEITWKSSHPISSVPAPPPPESASIRRANSDLSMYTPVRRRSVIQTPGVATRQNSVTGGGGGPRSSFRHSHPPTPNLSRQASLESMSGRVQSMPPPRLAANPDAPLGLVTPSEGDYQTFGAFKFGTLRIMNGSASPVAASPEPDEKYMIDRQGKAAGQPSQTSQPSSEYFLPQAASPGLRGGNAGWTASSRPSAAPPAAVELAVELAAPQPPPVPITAPVILTVATATIPSVHLSDPTSLAEGKFPASTDYLAEIQFSPFTLEDASPSPATPQLQITSKHTALEDDLFEDDAQPEYSTLEVLDLRLDPNAKSTGPSPRSSYLHAEPSQRSTQSTQSVARSDSGFVSSPTSESSHKPLSKTDSGYSSNVSLRSLRAGSKPPVPDKDLSRIAAGEVHQSSPSPRSDGYLGAIVVPSPIVLTIPENPVIPQAPSREAPPPPPPPKDVSVSVTAVATTPPKQQPSTATPTTTPTPPKGTRSADRLYAGYMAASAGVGKRRSSHLAPITSSSRLRDPGPKSPDSLPSSPMSAKSDTSIGTLSIGSGSNKPGRLSRFLSLGSATARARSGSGGPLTVHATHVDETSANIPSVPHDIQRQLNARQGLFPMTTKRLALRPQLSKETLKTILSVGSLEMHGGDEIAAPSSAGRSPEAVGPGVGLNRRHTYTPTPSSLSYETTATEVTVHETSTSTTSTATATVPLRKPIPRKPVPIRKDVAAVKKGQQQPEQSETTAAKAAVDPRPEPSFVNVPESDAGRAIITSSASSSNLKNLSASSSSSSTSRDSPTAAAASAAAPALGDDNSDLFFSPTGRPISMATHLERTLSLMSLNGGNISSLSPALPTPDMVPEVLAPRRTPPVSLHTRRMNGPLRVPPPLRPQSTPPRAQSLSKSSSVSSSSSSSRSQENLQSQYYYHMVYQQQQPQQQTSDPAPPPIPAMNPRRSLTSLVTTAESNNAWATPNGYQQQQQQQARVPDWQVKTDHDPQRRQQQSNSLEQQQQNDHRDATGPSQQRPSLPRRPLSEQQLAMGGQYAQQQSQSPSPSQSGFLPAAAPQQQQQLLRHRASYDGYNHHQQQQQAAARAAAAAALEQQQRQYYSRAKPVPSQQQLYQQQWQQWQQQSQNQNQNQWPPPSDHWGDPQLGGGGNGNGNGNGSGSGSGRYQPPYVPRGGSGNHHRNRSMSMTSNSGGGSGGSGGGRHGVVPYRILHSYNSPAYRNAPIWG